MDGSTTVEGAAEADFLFGLSNHDQIETRDSSRRLIWSHIFDEARNFFVIRMHYSLHR